MFTVTTMAVSVSVATVTDGTGMSLICAETFITWCSMTRGAGSLFHVDGPNTAKAR